MTGCLLSLLERIIGGLTARPTVASQTIDKSALRKSLEKVIEGIFEMDPGIRMVAVYQGQYILAGGMRKGVESYDPDDAYDIDMQLSKMGEIAQGWETWFDRLEGLTLKYGKLNLTFHPVAKGRFLIMSTEPEVNPFAVMKKIRSRPDFKKLTQSIP